MNKDITIKFLIVNMVKSTKKGKVFINYITPKDESVYFKGAVPHKQSVDINSKIFDKLSQEQMCVPLEGLAYYVEDLNGKSTPFIHTIYDEKGEIIWSI